MPREPKRKATGNGALISKKPKLSATDTPVRKDLLERCYARVSTLREHIISSLPSSSRLRRKKISSLGQSPSPSDLETQLAHVLDTSLVCTNVNSKDTEDTRWQQWLSFSQKGDESYVSISNAISGSIYSQSDIVDFVIWSLFSRDGKDGKPSSHVLCDGFRRVARAGDQNALNGTSIPGLFSLHPNAHVKILKSSPWPELLTLLGQSGEKMMIDLLLDHSIFALVATGFRNYRQLNGTSLSEVELAGSSLAMNKTMKDKGRKLADVVLVRSRIFYAKPALTAQGHVQPGFKHIHVLNRCPYLKKASTYKESGQETTLEVERRRHTIKVMMYVFPRQFGLHNAFTSEVNPRQTSQKFQDYTLREEEIAKAFPTKPGDQSSRLPKLPKRLRGNAEHLVQRLQVLHGRCSYVELLRYYCPCFFDRFSRSHKPRPRKEVRSTQKGSRSQPLKSRAPQSQQISRRTIQKPSQAVQLLPLPQCKSLVDLATPSSQVSIFCQAVLSKIIPDLFWGEDEIQLHNKSQLMLRVDHFIKLRRFEAMSLHEICQNFKISNINWLQPPGTEGQTPSKTDTEKRHEIFHEFLYYVFDSLLIPLLRTNFYVTESNTHRYQVFYFRHDVWKHIAEPSMANLKETMFEEVKLDDALRTLQSRRLGFSQIRLLPKGEKLRPITNLKRRTLVRGASKVLGPSINSVLAPVHTLLKLEKGLNPSKLGSTMFSVSDIYDRLKRFKESLGPNPGRLYFAKVDVQAAFDTIPQEAVVKLMASIPSQAKYTVAKHVEVKPGERSMIEGPKAAAKPIRRWHANALADGEVPDFAKRLESGLAGKKKNTVFVDVAMRRTRSTQELLTLLKEHVEQNLVKVGKKYYRQKVGIPQGSVLSSFLCNYFYADLEAKHLSFLDESDSLLLRLIDDTLLITLDKRKAVKFVTTMHVGLPEYGVQVSAKKTLVNFDMTFGGALVNKAERGAGFPYCGTLIDCETLDITRDRQRDAGLDITTSLTVDFGRFPGQNFQRKILNAFKIQSHLMYFDTAHNSIRSVLDSLEGAFHETAHKMWAYIRCLSKSQRPKSSLIIRTIIKVADVAFLLMTGKSRKMRFPEYACDVRKGQVSVIAYKAFADVLSRKQAKFEQVMSWLRTEMERLQKGKNQGSIPGVFKDTREED